MSETPTTPFPICPVCGYHAEMYFGEWMMCQHQRAYEEAGNKFDKARVMERLQNLGGNQANYRRL